MFQRIRGNAKGCLVVEPMFVVPFSLYSTYTSVYMLGLGVTNEQLGLLTSLGLILQIFSSFISGFLTDRMGRRKALMIFDMVSWSVATLIWAVSQNFWYFLAAALFNSFQKVPNTAWYCLLVEDTPPEERSIIFTVIQFIGVIGGLLAPIGGLLVGSMGLIPAVRIMYALSFVGMTAMFIIRNSLTHETEIGIRKASDKSALRLGAMLQEYLEVVRSVIGNRTLLILFGVYVLFQFQMAVRGTYLSVYLVDHLHFRDSVIAWFPAVSSAAMLILMYAIVPKFREARQYLYMQIGCAFSIASTVLLVFTPARAVGITILSTALFAIGTILANPYLESAVANAMQDEQRANFMSILSVLILIVISPSGLIGGWTYAIDPRIPFWIIAGTFALSMALLAWAMSRERSARTALPVSAAKSG